MRHIPFEFILAGGVPSSGSTLLSVLLDAHPDIFSGPETTLFCHPPLWQGSEGTALRDFANFLDGTAAPEGFIPWSYPDARSLAYYGWGLEQARLALAASPTMVDFVQGFYEKSSQYRGQLKVVEKTPQNLYAASAFLELSPTSKIILTIRSPLGVIPSLVRRGVNRKVAAIIWLWDAAVVRGLTTRFDKHRVHLVRYEDLVTEPVDQLNAVCHFLGVPPRAADMIARRASDRAQFDSSLRSNEGGASSVWQHSPLGAISSEAGQPASLPPAMQDVLTILANCGPDRTELSRLLHTRTGLPGRLSGRRLANCFRYSLPAPTPCKAAFDDALVVDNALNRYERDYFGRLECTVSSPSILDSFRVFWAYRIPATLKTATSGTLRAVDLLQHLVNLGARSGHLLARGLALIAGILGSLANKIERLVTRAQGFLLRRLGRVRSGISYRAAHVTQRAQNSARSLSANFVSSPFSYGVAPLPGDVCYTAVGVIAFQGRHGILDLVVRELLQVNQESRHTLGVVLACSNEADIQFASRLRAELLHVAVVMTPNNPLGLKWQRAVDCARIARPLYLIITGSDDIISSSFVTRNIALMENDDLGTIDMAAPRTWLLLDAVALSDPQQSAFWQLSYKNSHHRLPLGAGRIYSRAFLDKVSWQIFDCDLDRLLDDQGYNLLRHHNGTLYTTTLDDGFVLSVKGPWQSMNATPAILSAGSIAVEAMEPEFVEYVKSQLGDKFEKIRALQPLG